MTIDDLAREINQDEETFDPWEYYRLLDGEEYEPSLRTRAYTRKQRARKIAHRIYLRKKIGYPWYTDKGRYSKGKIHCSCKMCTVKTSRDYWSISDLRRQGIGSMRRLRKICVRD